MRRYPVVFVNAPTSVGKTSLLKQVEDTMEGKVAFMEYSSFYKNPYRLARLALLTSLSKIPVISSHPSYEEGQWARLYKPSPLFFWALKPLISIYITAHDAVWEERLRKRGKERSPTLNVTREHAFLYAYSLPTSQLWVVDVSQPHSLTAFFGQLTKNLSQVYDLFFPFKLILTHLLEKPS